MPFTGFHLLAGLLPAAVAPRKFNYGAFAVANVLLDLEPGWKLLASSGDSLHAYHTWGWAGVAAVLAFAAWWAVARSWELQHSAASMWVGAIVGAFSHILFDALYHAEVAQNSGLYRVLPAYEAGSLVETALLVAGFLGIVVIVLRATSSTPRRAKLD